MIKRGQTKLTKPLAWLGGWKSRVNRTLIPIETERCLADDDGFCTLLHMRRYFFAYPTEAKNHLAPEVEQLAADYLCGIADLASFTCASSSPQRSRSMVLFPTQSTGADKKSASALPSAHSCFSKVSRRKASREPRVIEGGGFNHVLSAFFPGGR